MALRSNSDRLRRATLTCRGTLCRRGGQSVVVLSGENCSGCSGRCRWRFPVPQLTLPAAGDLPEGTPVEVVAAARRFNAHAALVFGVPLLAALLAATVERTAAGAWLAPVALLAASAALVVVRLVCFRKNNGTTTIERDNIPLRIRVS